MQIGVIQVLGHPPLITNFHRLVCLTIAVIHQLAIFAVVFRFCFARSRQCNRTRRLRRTAAGLVIARTRRVRGKLFSAGRRLVIAVLAHTRRRIVRRPSHKIAVVVTASDKHRRTNKNSKPKGTHISSLKHLSRQKHNKKKPVFRLGAYKISKAKRFIRPFIRGTVPKHPPKRRRGI